MSAGKAGRSYQRRRGRRERRGAPAAARPARIPRVSEERLAFPRPELRRRTARGAIVNGFFLGGAEALVLLQGLIVIVLLGPSAIGLYGIVTTTAMTIVALKRIGIDEAFVQQSEAGQEEEFQRAFTLELALSTGFALLIAVSAPLVATVYGDDRLLWLTLAVAYLPVAFALQAPQWIFFRRMDFLRQRLLQAVVAVVTFCVTGPLAAAGVGAWSLRVSPVGGNGPGGLARGHVLRHGPAGRGRGGRVVARDRPAGRQRRRHRRDAHGLAVQAQAPLRQRRQAPLLRVLVADLRQLDRAPRGAAGPDPRL